MLKHLKNKKGQTSIVEYVLIFFLVIGGITAMSVYFKRAVQARIFDARYYMVKEVHDRTEGYYSGNLYWHYEPYYANTDASIVRRSEDVTTLRAGGTTGVFKKSVDGVTAVWTDSQTAAPKDAGLTTPGPE